MPPVGRLHIVSPPHYVTAPWLPKRAPNYPALDHMKQPSPLLIAFSIKIRRKNPKDDHKLPSYPILLRSIRRTIKRHLSCLRSNISSTTIANIFFFFFFFFFF
ncbi:hypothetical protein L6452_09936 [Arctium lappa]|uniref:Uncharacterized protein n=1 Tax=Arctium lappa TaxID=4217 RepID=A0ACB9DLX8_ARCLA|nr:hypothetical protein L6452_09936 [Arctium lappa]